MKNKEKKNIVVIGGLDPTGNAGLLADARVLQYYKMAAHYLPTAITVQSDEIFYQSESVSLFLFQKQLEILPKNIQGVKIGMLSTLGHAQVITRWLQKVKPTYVIWDPVFQSSSGGILLKAKKWNLTLLNLLKATTIFTPNRLEAQWILQSFKLSQKATLEGLRDTFGKKFSPEAILLKGGHDSSSKSCVKDILWDGKKQYSFRSTRRSKSPRGTGCALASALVAELLLEKKLRTAIFGARRYVQNHLFRES